ncbi:MAG TPA: PAS domain S-box protein, partial [Candidatus Binataceae bacterium]|nr:PAS domain S-box protein [Candidatus Binataceae bacterium]
MPDDLERAAASGQRSDGSSAISLRAIFDATLDGIVVVRTAALRPDRLGEDRPQLTPDETDDEEAFGAAPTEVIDVNLGFERLFGHSRDAAIGRDLNDLNLWTDLGARAQMAGELARQGHVHNLEAELRRKDGTAVCCLLSAAQVMIAGERFIVGLARDISLRKQNQRRLEESEATFRKLFDSNLDSMLLIDVADNQITAVNKRMLTASGYTQEELIGQPWSKLEMQSDGDVAVRIVQGLQQHGEIRNLETVARLKNGTTVPCLVSATLLELRGRLSCLLVIRDIAAIKAAEQQLIEARETALAASRAKSEFLSSMSHEIRTPLNVVLGMADLLAETRLDPDQRKYLNTMVSNGNLLLELINDILDLAKVEAGHLELDHTPFNLVEVTDRVCETLAVRAHVHHLELVSHVLPDTPVALIGDPLRLRQILINLLGNAIKFTEAGSVVLTVAKVREVAGKAELHFRVTDTGVGIAADKIDRIFDSFNQADSSTPRQYGGTGLGLAIVKRLIEVMGGSTWVESEVGKGSTFHFTVPFELESDCTMQSESARAPLDLSGVRTMVVDDTAANRVILREMLAAKGARVTEADSGRAALAAYAEALRSGTPFELLVLDCRMPEVDGLSVARHIGAMPDQGVAILMLTSDDLSMRPVHMRKLGIQAHLVKPIRRADLYHSISS